MRGDTVLSDSGWLPTEAVLASLGDPVRWRIVSLLHEGELSAGDVARQFEISRPAVSRHLAILRASGVVRHSKRAQQVVYRLDRNVVGQVGRQIARLAESAGPDETSFNDRARQALTRAMTQGDGPISRRILEAVLEDAEAEASQALRALGIDIPEPLHSEPPADALPGEPLQEVLADALAEARSLGRRRVGTLALAIAALAHAGTPEESEALDRLRRFPVQSSDGGAITPNAHEQIDEVERCLGELAVRVRELAETLDP